MRFSGGCQCGAVRYACEEIRRATVCHCRMCQKAFGNTYGPLADFAAVTWTRGEPSWFQSSNMVKRGFCNRCGTPLAYKFGDRQAEVAICTLDDPNAAAPVEQLSVDTRIDWTNGIHRLPTSASNTPSQWMNVIGGLVSYQHPDEDTADWPVSPQS